MYDASKIPSARAFEFLVFLVLRTEHSESRLELFSSPDGGIDILCRTGSHVVAYQCKHFARPNVAQIRREIRISICAAIKLRPSLKWERYEICFSSSLTAKQRGVIAEMAQSLGLAPSEWGVRTGADFFAAVLSKPELWDFAISASNLRLTGLTEEHAIGDDRLTALLQKLDREGASYDIVRFDEYGIDTLADVWDWYSVAAKFYTSSSKCLHTISADREIAEFWLSKHGDEYADMNRRIVDRGVDLKRLYVFDFANYTMASRSLINFLYYCAVQEKEGLPCRVLGLDTFRSEVPYDCFWFAIQDSSNVVFYSRDNYRVHFSTQREIVKDAEDVFEHLYQHHEAKSPQDILRKYDRS